MRTLDIGLSSSGFTDEALCAVAVANGAAEHDDWFALGSSPRERQALANAKAICAACPVAAECHTYADRLQDADPALGVVGVWGGRARTAGLNQGGE